MKQKFTLLILSAFILLQNQAYSQKELWGTTSDGGKYHAGVIYKTDLEGNNYTIEYNFPRHSGQYPEYTELYQASNGKLYGVTSDGGENYDGVLYEYDPVEKEYTVIHHFKSEMGYRPYGALIEAEENVLYGLTSDGGDNFDGVIYKYNLITDTYTVLSHFDGLNGKEPYGKLLRIDMDLYGMTMLGGNYNDGVIFKYDLNNDTCIKVMDFEASLNGGNPYNSLIQTSDGKIYGMTTYGGTSGEGTVFEFDPVTDTIVQNINLEASVTGSEPYGELTEASNGMLYASTYYGGKNNHGAIFELNPTNFSLKKKYDLQYDTTGSNPEGGLLEAETGYLYGLCYDGGVHDRGTLYKYSIEEDTIYVQNNFYYEGLKKGADPDIGNYPSGTLMKATNGNLYGITNDGGQEIYGTLFEYSISEDTLITRVSFDAMYNGGEPEHSFIQIENKLYGTTVYGAKENSGVIYTYDLVLKKYEILHHFEIYSTGVEPKGDLLHLNGKLYGIATAGGENSEGVIFEYSLKNKKYTKLYDLDPWTDGYSGEMGLTLGDNGKLYGTMYRGGANAEGTLFEYTIETNEYKVIKTFDGTSGENPACKLVQHSNGKIYGTTERGGTYSEGTIFSYDPAGETFTTIHHFGQVNSLGRFPVSQLIESPEGNLYGITFTADGDYGAVFEFNPETADYTKIGNITWDGMWQQKSIMLASNNKLYGTTYTGGTDNRGVLFSLDLSNNEITKKHDFVESTGCNPYYGYLLEICPPQITNLTETICNGDSIFLENAYQKTAGTYYDTLATICGSDSIIETTLYVNPTYHIIDDVTICSGESYTWEEEEYAEAGTYTKEFSTIYGCDSIRVLNLDFYPVYNETDEVEICKGDNYTFGTQTLTETGEYVEAFESMHGCDSTVTLTLNVFSVDTSVTQNDSELAANATDATFQWIDCETNSIITGETNSTFTPSVTGNYKVEVTQSSCVDTSSCYNVNITSIYETKLGEKINIYPNPAQNYLYIDVPDGSNGLSYTVINMLGQIVIRDNINDSNKRVNVSTIKSGVYFISIYNDQKGVLKTVKMIKE
ncbi:MAG: T9SS type A sorting domain-containing protein [Bacteroidetes bacterium]|nr:T9SS type A sorting domain-containing protein [Bacteroidota bacterium]